MTDWRPIDSAPRDGTRVLLFSSEGVDVGAFEPWWHDGMWLRTQTAEYNNEGAPIREPSHWMPLPDPPEAA